MTYCDFLKFSSIGAVLPEVEAQSGSVADRSSSGQVRHTGGVVLAGRVPGKVEASVHGIFEHYKKEFGPGDEKTLTSVASAEGPSSESAGKKAT